MQDIRLGPFDDSGFMFDIGALGREATNAVSGQYWCETVYRLTSCSPAKADAKQLLDWTQAYWHIENGRYYRRDAALGEDQTRIANQRFAGVLSILNNVVASLTQKPQLINLAYARRQFDARTSELLAHVHDY